MLPKKSGKPHGLGGLPHDHIKQQINKHDLFKHKVAPCHKIKSKFLNINLTFLKLTCTH